MLEVGRNNSWSEAMPYTQRKFILSMRIYFIRPKKVNRSMISQLIAMLAVLYHVNLDVKISSAHLQWWHCFQIQRMVCSVR